MPDNLPTMELQREKKVRKTKKKGARWRNGETPESIAASHAKLHQLFMEEQIKNAYNDPARHVKLKKRPDVSPFNSKSGKSYMEKFVESSSVGKTMRKVSVVPLSLQWKQDNVSESGLEVPEESRIGPVKGMLQANGRDDSSPNIQVRQYTEDLEDFKPITNGERDEVSSTAHAAVEEKEIMLNGDDHSEDSMEKCNSDEITSEVENYLDAPATIESEIETDTDSRSRHNMTLLDIGKGGTDSDANEDMEIQTDMLGSHSVGNSASEDGNSSFERSSGSMYNDGASLIVATQFVGDRFSKMVHQFNSNSADNTNVTNDQLTQNKEPFGMELKALEVSTNTDTEADAACDIRAASQPLYSPNLKNTCAPINAGWRTSTRREQEDTSPHCMRCTNEFSYFNEVKEIIADSSTMASNNMSNQMGAYNVPVNEHPNGCSIDMEHSPDNLKPTYESKRRPDAGAAAKSFNGISLRMDSPQSRLSLEEQHKFSPHAGEDVSADYSPSVSISGDSDEEASGVGDEVNDAIAMSSPVVNLKKSTVAAEEQQVYVKDEKFLHETTSEGNLLGLDLQHKRVDQVIHLTIDGENSDSLKYNMEACGGQSRDTIHLGIQYAGCDIGSESGESTLIRVNLNNSCAILDESNVLQDPYLDEMEKFPLHEDNLREGDIEKKERNCEGFTQDGQNKDDLIFNFKAVGGVCTSLIPSDGDDTMVHDLVTQGVQAGTDISEVSIVEVGVRQEMEDFCKAMSPGWNKESGLESKVDEGEATHADLDPSSAANWDSTTHGDNNAVVGSNDPSLTKQTPIGLVCDRRTTSMDLGDVVLRLENSVASPSVLLLSSTTASEEPEKLLVNETSADSHLTDGEISKSPILNAEVAPSLDLLDGDSVCVSEAAPELGSKLQEKAHNIESQQVTGATQLLDHENQIQSPNSSNQEREQGSEMMLETFLIRQPTLTESLQEPMVDTRPQNFHLLSVGNEANLLEMPPLPPLPPVQWRMGKPQNLPSSQDTKFPQLDLSLFPPSLADENLDIEFSASKAGTPFSYNPFLGGTPLSHNPFLSPWHLETKNPDQSCVLQMLPTPSDPGNNSNDMVVKPLTSSLSPEPTFGEPSKQYFLASDTKVMQASPQPHSVWEDTSTSPLPGSSVVEPDLSMEQPLLKTDTRIINLQHDTENAESVDSSNWTGVSHDSQNPPNCMEEKAGLDQQALFSKNEAGKTNGTLIGNIPRPPKPLIEAVAAHDRSKLRKVAERVRPQLGAKLEERDSLLEQIRTKSFNLKPATAARPNIQQGPKTNLKFAAILAKANAIRQVLAGSDEDDDADHWSE
ncbi:hypothetical protein SAY86_022092 [Trapa natans]|uniref:Protein SCAR n=1 Tax=Trapa natans TaxID=22666 RepID=A0AAN7RG31_TRANT|nr:hypothetical protein SAY86_022092 [Trapa natans]